MTACLQALSLTSAWFNRRELKSSNMWNKHDPEQHSEQPQIGFMNRDRALPASFPALTFFVVGGWSINSPALFCADPCYCHEFRLRDGTSGTLISPGTSSIRAQRLCFSPGVPPRAFVLTEGGMWLQGVKPLQCVRLRRACLSASSSFPADSAELTAWMRALGLVKIKLHVLRYGFFFFSFPLIPDFS